MSCGIYKITNPEGKIYIGSSKNIERRWESYKDLKVEDQPKIFASLKEHGPENHSFEIIEECEQKYLLEREQHWIDQDAPELNVLLDVFSPPKWQGKNHKEDSKKKISESMRKFRKDGLSSKSRKIVEKEEENKKKSNASNEKKNLSTLIGKLDGTKIDVEDIEQLTLQLILDSSMEKTKVDGLKILVELKKNQRKKDHGDSLLDLLGDE